MSTSTYVGIGLGLNETGGTTSVKSAYPYASNGIVGFAITVTGTTGGAGLRFGFPGQDQQTNPTLPAPFVPQAGPASSAGMTYQIMLSQAQVPQSWNVANKGAKVDPNGIFDVQVEIAGDVAATYNFCVTGIKPIVSGDAGGTTCQSSYGKVCGSQDVVTGVGNYTVQNNIFNGGAGQCVQPSCAAGNAGFSVTFPNGSFGSGGSSPSSYPSVIYGWSNGTFYPGSTLPKQLSAINSANSTWSYNVPGGTYDAAYDIWLATSPTAATPGLELMIWVGDVGPQPSGGSVRNGITVPMVGGTWDVWHGHVSQWEYLAYRSTSPSGSGNVSFDLNKFFQDAVANAGPYGLNPALTSNWYLLGIQAGFEIYSESGTLTTNSFAVNVQ
jgi:hypothetical protein